MNKKSRGINNSVGNLLEEINEQDMNLDKYGANANQTITPYTGGHLTVATLYYQCSKITCAPK